MNSFETLLNLLENNERLFQIRETNELLYNIDSNIKKGKLLGELIEMSKDIFDKHGITKESFDMANEKAKELKTKHKLPDLLEYTADFDKIFSDKPEFLSYNPEGSSVPKVLSVEEVNEPKVEPDGSRVVPEVLSVEPDGPSVDPESSSVEPDGSRVVPKVLSVVPEVLSVEEVKSNGPSVDPESSSDKPNDSSVVPEEVTAKAKARANEKIAIEKYRQKNNLSRKFAVPAAVPAAAAAAAAGGTLKKLKRLQKKSPHK